jgi:nucleotide-binding universal stress UspA family protein
MIRTILAPLAEGLDSEALLDATLPLGQKFNSHIRAVFIRPDPDTLRVLVPEIAGGAWGAYAELERKFRESVAEQRRRFEDWRARRGLPTDVAPGYDGCSASWSEQIGDIESIVTKLGRVNDLIVVERPVSAALATQSCFDAAVFGTGRPTLVLSGHQQRDITDHVMIAWNGSLEATRATAAAMPFLHRSKRVSIFTSLKYGTDTSDLGDLAEALRWHGIRTPEVVFPDKAESTGPALEAAANKHEATMLVMGAYTHSRLRQTFLGGVTEYLLAHSPIPLLMSH